MKPSHWFGSWRRSRRGATAVEFALMFPVLFFMAAGIATYAWFFMVQSALVDSVAEGARRAAKYIPAPGEDDDDGNGSVGGGEDVDGDDKGFGYAIILVAEAETKAAAERAGWDPNFVTVQATMADVGGINMITINATADIKSRFGGLWFPIPPTVSSTLTVATLDQPDAP